MNEKIKSLSALSEMTSELKEYGDKIVLCHGCFDILHAGHLAYFEEARKNGDHLIVTLTSDRFVNKGPGRPYFKENVRAEMLSALLIVDYVAIVDDPTALPAIEAIKPDFYVKGQDYLDKSNDITGGILDEELAVKKCGGQLKITKSELDSSSSILNRFFIPRTEEQIRIINQVNELGGMKKIKEIMEDVSKLSVLVIGEPILDVYRFVEPQNISSKYPCISAKFLREEKYMGGSIAIANHLQSFCTVDTPTYGNDWPKKTRYISEDKSQRIFELTEINENGWDHELFANVNDAAYDVTILADFGHGLFNDGVLKACEQIKNFVALNVQTNSSNYGFNTFQKHKRWDYLVLDKRELQLAYHDNKESVSELATSLYEEFNPRRHFSVTLGPNGSEFWHRSSDRSIARSPAFADQIVDATGAGDAYFAITSLLVKVGAPAPFIPFIGNVFAGLKTRIIGNKSSVSKASLMKALEALLK